MEFLLTVLTSTGGWANINYQCCKRTAEVPDGPARPSPNSDQISALCGSDRLRILAG